MSPEFAVQRGLYLPIKALGYTVYDAAPQAADGGDPAAFPYVEVGAVVLAAWDDKTVDGFDVAARIHTRSRSGSMKEAKDIQGAIYAVLHHGAPAIAGYRTVLFQRETSDVTRAADGSFHGICEYRGLIEAI